MNDAHRRARLDLLYACDGPWWDHYGGVPDFAGIKVTQDEKAARKFGLRFVQLTDGVLGREPGFIVAGGNSGYQAMNIAYQLGVRRMILLGYDMHGPHWFKNRPDKFKMNSPFHLWVKNFTRLAQELAREKVEVINCSPGSALECFKKATLSSAL